jgi:transglutaminase-like putative cysteine protease
MRAARIPHQAFLAFTLFAFAAGAVGRADDTPAPAAPAAAKAEGITRWYENFQQGQKVGWTKVIWSASTWKDKPTVHDHTESLRRTVRDMAGHKDVFQSRSVYDIERDEDGTLWWLRAETFESDRRSRTEFTWTGTGYDTVETVGDEEKKVVVPLDAPVSVDLEARLSKAAREGTLEVGQKLQLRELDVEGRRARVREIVVLGPEETESVAGPVATVKVVLRYPETGSEEWMWIDREGAFVRTRGDAGGESRRASAEKATKLPKTAPSFAITSKSIPPLERVMSADRLWVDVRLAADPERKLPEFPSSPWSTASAPVAEEGGGWRIPVVLTAYDDPSARATLPVDRAKFAKELESTPLMPCGHADLAAVVKEAVGEEKNARKAAERLARWVHDNLAKSSPDVAEASALQILEERRGDCSEHGLLFTALCRAAGIPARRCSGWVNIGSDWGGHAWTEIWVGAWIGADPTTGEVGTSARYLFFGYPDDPDSYPGVASGRIAGRISLVATRIEEDGVAFDLQPSVEAGVLTGGEGPARWWLHVPTGLEARGIPEGWSVRLLPHRRGPRVEVNGPEFTCRMVMQADQGEILEEAEADQAFAGVPTLPVAREGGRAWLIHSRRRMIHVDVDTHDEAKIALLQRVLAPTFAPKVTDPRTWLSGRTEIDLSEVLLGGWTLDRAATESFLLAQWVLESPKAGAEELKQRATKQLDGVRASLLLELQGTFLLTIARPDAGNPGGTVKRTVVRGLFTGNRKEGIELFADAERATGERLGDAVLVQDPERLRLRHGKDTFLLQPTDTKPSR